MVIGLLWQLVIKYFANRVVIGLHRRRISRVPFNSCGIFLPFLLQRRSLTLITIVEMGPSTQKERPFLKVAIPFLIFYHYKTVGRITFFLFLRFTLPFTPHAHVRRPRISEETHIESTAEKSLSWTSHCNNSASVHKESTQHPYSDASFVLLGPLD